MTKRTLAWRLALLAAFIAPCASAQIHIYSEIRDKQGAAVKKSWEAIDLDGVVTTERANLKALLDAELETQDSLAAAVREQYLRYMMSATVREALVDPLRRRYLRLHFSAAEVDKMASAQQTEGVKQVDDAVGRVREARTSYNARQTKFRLWQPDYDKYRLGAPGCASVAGGVTPEPFTKALADENVVRQVTAGELLTELRKACGDIAEDSGAEVYKAFGGTGEVAEALAQWTADQDALVAEKKRVEAAKVEYRKALKEYEDATKAPPAEAQAKVDEAAKKVAKAVDALDKLQSAQAVSFLSQERIDSIQAVVKSITSAEDGKAPEGSSKTAQAFVIVPVLIDKGVKSMAEAKLPLALPLLMQRDLEQLQLEAATRDVAARNVQIDLSKKLVALQFQRAAELRIAMRDIAGVSKHWGARIPQAFGAASPDEQELLYGSATRYLEELRRFDAQRTKIEYMRIGAMHERALAYAEINIKQWKALIGTTVTQLADYGASGIKAEDVGRLVNAAGVLWIGNGVNK